MAQYLPDCLFIASIYPGQVWDVRRSYGASRENFGKGAERSTLFHIPPVARGAKPYVLPVLDSFEKLPNLIRSQGKNKVYDANPVAAEDIVADLLTQWVEGMFNVPPGAKPGIGQFEPGNAELKQFKDKFMQFTHTLHWPDLQDLMPKPPLDCIRRLETQQTEYFEFWLQEGEKIYRSDTTAIRNWTGITQEMKLAASWLGRDRPWSDPRQMAGSEPCPFCRAMLDPMAYVCHNCHKTVREIPPKLLKLLEMDRKGNAAAREDAL